MKRSHFISGWEVTMPLREKGEILWMVMLLLVLLALGMMHVASQQMQAARVNQWHDISLRTGRLVDQALARFAQAPMQFPFGFIAMGESHIWPSASLFSWQKCPNAVHEFTAWGGEVHVIIEAVPDQTHFFRLNALGYHPSGTRLTKQWVVACAGNVCRRLSAIEVSQG